MLYVPFMLWEGLLSLNMHAMGGMAGIAPSTQGSIKRGNGPLG